jgi:hypothetical protein
MSKKITPRHRATTRPQTQSFEAMARAYAGRATLIPSITDLLDATEDAAMIEAYIDHNCDDDCKASLRADAQVDRESDQTPQDIVWIRQEIAFALGVEIGRRLRGDR